MSKGKEYIDVTFNDDYGTGGVVEFNKLVDVDGVPRVVALSGYVRTEIDEDNGHFLVTVVNAEGDVLSETAVPFDFRGAEDDDD